ncbi:MAG: TIGR03619 family F420-dependent LLM class oxidoreductase [Chloroflexi bacterium]|nr:TIGR03619 family F420-dependent LLM class oxidoreductase [Chloroflexota bacterium]
MSASIGLGIAQYPFSRTKGFWRWIEQCERGDVDSIWQTDRLVSSQPMLEPMSLMAALAGGTERLQFGMNVVVLPLRDPLLLAKQCATIDFLSDGRLIPAFGVGGDAIPEWAAVGRSKAHRGGIADEMIAIMTRLWEGEEVTFAGEHFRYTRARIAPLPVRRPMPLWIGGSSRAAIRRTARLGTGWLSGIASPARVGPVVAAIREEAERAGRAIEPDHYGAGFPFRFGSWHEPFVEQAARGMARFPEVDDPRDYLAVGDARTILDRLDDYRRAGVSKFVLRPLAASEDDVFAQTQRLIEEVIPAVHVRAPA